MKARSWLVVVTMCTLVCASGCGSARWGRRHSRLKAPRACVESSCSDPTCEICSPLPPLYDGMARNHRLNRHGRRDHGRHGHSGCACGSCGCGTEWFEGEIIEGEIIGGDCFGGCSSCMSCGDGMVIDGGMPMEMMMDSGGCQTCQHSGMSSAPMMHGSSMPGSSHEMQYEPQPTPAGSLPPAPPSSASPMGSSVPGELAPGGPMSEPDGTPMGSPMSSMRTPNYGAALFNQPPSEPQHYVPAPESLPVTHEQPSLTPAPPAPPLASPAAHSEPMYLSPPPSISMPSLPAPMTVSAPAESSVYMPQANPIQLQSGTMPSTTGKKPMRPFSEGAKPRKPAAQPQWEATLEVQATPATSTRLPALP